VGLLNKAGGQQVILVYLKWGKDYKPVETAESKLSLWINGI